MRHEASRLEGKPASVARDEAFEAAQPRQTQGKEDALGRRFSTTVEIWTVASIWFGQTLEKSATAYGFLLRARVDD